mmetsp:Transcript_33943/g.88918  ORF Transcript_33943/g.88918 Transcript_33943/m.88918 type:complete len:202 (-) Transcript_33943:1821-2426(-)
MSTQHRKVSCVQQRPGCMHIRLPGVLEAQTAHRYEILDAEPHQSQSIKSVPRRATPTRAPHSHWLCCEWMQYICCDNTFASPIVPLRTTWKNARRSSWDPRLPILGTAPGPSRQHGAAVARTHREGRHGACEHRPERERERTKKKKTKTETARERESARKTGKEGEGTHGTSQAATARIVTALNVPGQRQFYCGRLPVALP